MRNKVFFDAGKTYHTLGLSWLIIPSAYRQPERLSLEAELMATRLPPPSPRLLFIIYLEDTGAVVFRRTFMGAVLVV